MPNTVKYAPDLYTNPPKTAIPGARVDYRDISLLTTDLITTQIIALGILPAGHRLMNLELESDALDSGSDTITVTVGILNSYYNQPVASVADPGWDDGTSPVLATGYDIIQASNIARAGGRAQPTATLDFTRTIGVDHSNDRIIGVGFPAAPNTAAAGHLAIICTIDED